MTSTSTQNPRILIAEDNLLIAEQVSKILKNEEIKLVNQVRFLSKNLNLPKGEQPDLIMMNIQLADQEVDFEFVSQISRKWKIPVILLTGYARKMLSKEMFDLPEIYFLQKPFLPFQLTAVLQNALNPK